MWLGNLFRSLFLLIDGVVYWAVNILYQLFIMISETGIFTPENIKTFGSRIYVLLGVFMLFKVSFSFINYILNPDTFSDKSKGVNKLLMNFFVVLIGIVAVPYIFQAAYSLQAIVLKDNVIGSLVMGMNAKVMGNNDYDYIEQGGKLMSYTTLSAFIRLKPDIVGEECAANPVVAVTDENGPVYENGVRKAELNPACALGDVNGALEVKVNGSTVGETLVKAYSENNTNYFTLTGLVNATVVEGGEETWIFDYSIILSTIAGGFLAWILLIFCIDVATRSVKLGFLQLIAPIPIISYIDPKNGKDGIFKKWTKECTGTYLSLFVRLLAIYFVLFIITLILNGEMVNVTTGNPQTNLFVKIFIIFGALMFAKDLPKLISDITGVKLDGGFTLNPLKKLGSSPYAAGAMGLVGGAVGGGIANAYAAYKNNLGWRKGTLSTLGGVFGAGRRGLMAGATGGGKGSLFDSAVKGITDSSSRRNLRKYGRVGKDGKPLDGYSTWDMIMDKATTMGGVKHEGGTSSQLKSELNLLQQKLANSKRNEHSMSTALNQKISDSDKMMAGLFKTFDGAMRAGADGKPEYVKKTYADYLESVAKMHAESSGVDWASLTDAGKAAIKSNVVSLGVAGTEDVFNEFNTLYETRNNEDLVGKALEKQIKDMQEDMDKFKGKKS